MWQTADPDSGKSGFADAGNRRPCNIHSPQLSSCDKPATKSTQCDTDRIGTSVAVEGWREQVIAPATLLTEFSTARTMINDLKFVEKWGTQNTKRMTLICALRNSLWEIEVANASKYVLTNLFI